MADRPQAQTIAGVRVWQPLRGPFERWPLSTDFCIATLAFALTLAMWGLGTDQSMLTINTLGEVAVYLCAFVASFALLWRRSHPWQVHAVVLLASVLVYLSSINDGIVAVAFSLYCLGRYEANRRASVAGAVVAFLFIGIDTQVLSSPDIGSTIAAALVLALWYVGRRLRFRGEYLRLLEERAGHLERERNAVSERAVAAERTRIAREMHDVVAHQVSLMTVQAGAAKTVNESDPDAARDAMAAVENAGRNALAEMRHLLGVLRPSDQASELLPQPGVADLPALVNEVRDAGPGVKLQTTGSATGLSKRLELAVYRIVQEALTNVIKHAGTDVTVTVDINIDRKHIDVRIKDNGEGGDIVASGGHGIVGMRERVELLGGTFNAGAAKIGGFEIHAILPRKENTQ